MLTSLSSGVAGMQNFQTSLDVIGNNIANSNTAAFKSGRADFADALSDTLQSPTQATANSSGTAPVQVGVGVQTVAVQNMFTQGSINPTGVPSDLAVSGNGFFVVKDPTTQQTFVTRDGQFTVDSNGYMVTAKGMRLQGYTDGSLSTIGDVQIDGTGSPSTTTPPPSMKDYTIDSQGQINVTMSDGSVFVRGQVLLQSFQNPQALVKEGNNLFSGIALAGPLGGTSPQAQAPSTNGLGKIQSQALEASNVDLTTEFANMITAERGFQANSRIITTSDEILQDILGMKR